MLCLFIYFLVFPLRPRHKRVVSVGTHLLFLVKFTLSWQFFMLLIIEFRLNAYSLFYLPDRIFRNVRGHPYKVYENLFLPGVRFFGKIV